MATRVIRKDRFGFDVVALRNHGYEALVYLERTDGSTSLGVHTVARDGTIAFEDVLWSGRELRAGLEEHCDDLE